ATHVRCDDAKAGLCQRRDLMPPRVPGFGPAVAHHHQRAIARLDIMNADAVGGHGAMLDTVHHVYAPAAVCAILSLVQCSDMNADSGSSSVATPTNVRRAFGSFATMLSR